MSISGRKTPRGSERATNGEAQLGFDTAVDSGFTIGAVTSNLQIIPATQLPSTGEVFVVTRVLAYAEDAPNEGAAYELKARVSTVAGVATIVNQTQSYVSEDAAGWDAVYAIAADLLVVACTSDDAARVDWQISTQIYQISA